MQREFRVTEKAEVGPPTSIIEGTPAALGESLGWDTQRIWATAVQVFLNPDHGLIVFKEQLQVRAVAIGAEPDDEPPLPLQAAISRNVASVVMPRDVLIQFRDVLLQLLPLDADDK